MVQHAGIWQAVAGEIPHWDLQISPNAAFLWTHALKLTHEMGTGVSHPIKKLQKSTQVEHVWLFLIFLPCFLFECVFFFFSFRVKYFLLGLHLATLGLHFSWLGLHLQPPLYVKLRM